jgi:hypothetical protein
MAVDRFSLVALHRSQHLPHVHEYNCGFNASNVTVIEATVRLGYNIAHKLISRYARKAASFVFSDIVSSRFVL